jgi:membrane-associated phospholipid phosphatase
MNHARWQLTPLITYTVISALLFGSWLFEPTRSFWLSLDSRAFWAMNNSLAEGKTWQTVWAIANNRLFDLVAGLSMMGLLAHYALLRDRKNLKRHIAVGTVLFLTLVVALQTGKAIPIERPSATAVFENALRLTELVPEIDTKDYSSDSFPGDHGVVLLVCAVFIARHLPAGYGLLAALFAVAFTLPRLMSGAHWLTDELVGAVSLCMLLLSWLFATPLYHRLTNSIETLLYRWPKSGN